MSVHSIAIGPSSSALLDSKGELYTFGYGGSTLAGVGQLGHGDGESVLKPKLVQSIIEDGCYVKQVECGESHTVVLTTEGEVLCTGAGAYGRLGNFETIDQLFFEPVELLTSGVEQIAVGKSFALALKDGLVHGWGRNHKGQVRSTIEYYNILSCVVIIG
jgi:alpha-tubulin suppressor-like RCC1 family protein